VEPHRLEDNARRAGTQLPLAQNRTWISDEATERFGVVETWEDAAGDFPDEIRELIGKEPDIAEEFDVEA
jgi:hypothetical protein